MRNGHRSLEVEIEASGNGLELSPSDTAEAVGLRYVTDAGRGIQRRRIGRGFVYLRWNGGLIRDEATLNRIRALAIPPAWENVWICPRPNGHLQATGNDARGRKQYLYHTRFRETRDRWKFGRLIAFAASLPAIRSRVEADLARRGLPREKVLATVVKLLETTLIRVGNDEYVERNRSFGLTTMRDQHAKIGTTRIRFEFRGKGGKEHEIHVVAPRLARIVRQCQELPGQRLFVYFDAESKVRAVTSQDVNKYLREISGQDFTAKDFRTWAGTALTAWALGRRPPPHSQRAGRRYVNEAVAEVADQLGNTKTVCRNSYIHPEIIRAYLDRRLHGMLELCFGRARQRRRGLAREEAAVLYLLEQFSAAPQPHRRRPPLCGTALRT
mgnify:CR=1 FL=1